MISDIDAIAFDIDGTLYPDSALFSKLTLFALSNYRVFVEFGKVRKEIRLHQTAHPEDKQTDFFGYQAGLFARRVGWTEEKARSWLDKNIYEGWKEIFTRVRPYPHLDESFSAYKAAGLKIGIMSDFPPEQKGDIWGLAKYADAIIGTESCGALKPSAVPFRALAQALGTAPERILYVGNSFHSDVVGARNAGMKSACIVSPLAAFFGKKVRDADISFSSYRQLTRIVLK